MTNKFVRYFKGWVQFEVSGEFLSDFLQKVSDENITVWDIIKNDKQIILKSNIKDYKYIARIAHKSKNKIRIKKKYGFAFKKYKYRKRIGLYIGIFIFLFCLVFSQNFIWQIKFTEYDNQKLDYLKHEIENYGIKVGAYYGNLDFKNIQQNILKENQNLSRISFNRNGPTLSVEISPRIKNKYLNEKNPCNIIADKTAQIISVDNYSGTKEVQAKEIVMPGDILISGKQLTQDGGYKAVHADGKIIAHTYFNHTISFAYNQKEKEYKQSKNRYSLELLDYKIPLFIDFKIDENYDIKSSKKDINIFGIKLPISIICDNYRTYDFIDKKFTEEEALNQINKSFNEYENVELNNSKIIEKTDKINKENDKISITRKYIVEEEIGQKQSLDINN